MEFILDERFNESSGLLERIIALVGQNGEDFSQNAEISVTKEYYLNGQIVHAEVLYDYTKPENDITLKENW